MNFELEQHWRQCTNCIPFDKKPEKRKNYYKTVHTWDVENGKGNGIDNKFIYLLVAAPHNEM